LINAPWYNTILLFIEFIVGSIVGTEIIWNDIKKAGKSIVGITVGEAAGTFVVVTAVFGIVFAIQDIPIFLAFIFGGIALATAPVPALSIVKEYDAKGPVTKTLTVLAALDDMIAVTVFFVVMAIVSGTVIASSMPMYMIPVILIAPILLGFIGGWITSWLLRKTTKPMNILMVFVGFILLTTIFGNFVNTLLPYGSVNYLLMGMAFSATVANLIPKDKLIELLKKFNPISNVAFILFIVNLGFPLDYRLILGAGIFSVIYMISRALGKYFGTWASAKVFDSPEMVRKYLGFTLLPHSGVSLAFTSIAASMLAPVYPDLANIIIGTISSAAIINEIIAVIIAKKAFKLAGEIPPTS